MNQYETMRGVVTTALTQLPEEIRGHLNAATRAVRVSKPAKGLEIHKLTIVANKPAGFWDRDWCAYELGLGTYDGKPTWGGVSFYCFTHNARCGGGLHHHAVKTILASTLASALKDFELVEQKSLSLKRIYLQTTYRELPEEEMAGDLARLIENTFPQFQKLTGKTAAGRRAAATAGRAEAQAAAVRKDEAAPRGGDKRARLVAALKDLPDAMRRKLDQLKQGAKDLDRPDFLWHFLLQSFATMGNSRGWRGLIGTPENYRRIRYEELAKLSEVERRSRLLQVTREAKIRMAAKKAEWLAKNFQLIESMGGLAGAKRLALSAPGTTGKIGFLKTFSGIGDKYARNIWMDVYHPDFYDAIAIDERIQAVTRSLGLSFTDYEQHEGFYREVAREAGLQGWELDRLLYNYRDHFLRAIG